MIASFSEGAGRFSMTMDGAVGAGVFLIVLGLGISMILGKQTADNT